MDNLPRRRLRELIVTHGPSVIDDPGHCERLLRTICGEYRREFFVLAGALKEGVLAALSAAPVDASRSGLLTRLTQQLRNNLAMTEEAARWAVETWALALGVIDEPGGAPVVIVSAQGAGDYDSIAAALRSASPGTRIVVHPGYYTGGLVIDRAVEIFGDGPAAEIVVESVNAPCVQIQTDQALIRGLTLRSRVELRGSKYYAVEITQGRPELEDCDIASDSLACVAVHGAAAEPIIRRCRIHDGQGFGVSAYEHAGAILEDCARSSRQIS
ncbi:MAG TPA: hypothetical protein G4O02_15870 [Caldilineae bacterium]|nr:hypothetical protein [Caldilineae bacterium]